MTLVGYKKDNKTPVDCLDFLDEITIINETNAEAKKQDNIMDKIPRRMRLRIAYNKTKLLNTTSSRLHQRVSY